MHLTYQSVIDHVIIVVIIAGVPCSIRVCILLSTVWVQGTVVLLKQSFSIIMKTLLLHIYIQFRNREAEIFWKSFRFVPELKFTMITKKLLLWRSDSFQMYSYHDNKNNILYLCQYVDCINTNPLWQSTFSGFTTVVFGACITALHAASEQGSPRVGTPSWSGSSPHRYPFPAHPLLHYQNNIKLKAKIISGFHWWFTTINHVSLSGLCTYHTFELLRSRVVTGSIGITGVFTWEAVVGQLTPNGCVTHIALLTQATGVTTLQWHKQITPQL